MKKYYKIINPEEFDICEVFPVPWNIICFDLFDQLPYWYNDTVLRLKKDKTLEEISVIYIKEDNETDFKNLTSTFKDKLYDEVGDCVIYYDPYDIQR